MPRARLPSKVAKITGAETKNRGRFVGRSDPKVAPLGLPPETMSDAEVAEWHTFAKEFPWLAESDRTLVYLACRLKARLVSDPDFGVNAMAQLRMCLSAMGGTPADRSKVGGAPDDEDDKSAEFLN